MNLLLILTTSSSPTLAKLKPSGIKPGAMHSQATTRELLLDHVPHSSCLFVTLDSLLLTKLMSQALNKNNHLAIRHCALRVSLLVITRQNLSLAAQLLLSVIFL